jgi:hypothetical protein
MMPKAKPVSLIDLLAVRTRDIITGWLDTTAPA